MKKLIALTASLLFIFVGLAGFTSTENMPLENWTNFLIGDEITPDDEFYYLISEQDSKVSNSEGTGFWDTLNTDGGDLYSDLDMSKSSSLTEIAKRLRALSISYSTPNSAYYQDPNLLADIEHSLTYFSESLYNPSIPEYDNWWDWEIGVSLAIDDILILLDGQLEQTLVDNLLAAIDTYIPDPSIDKWGNPSTGANLLDRTLAKTLRYVITNDKANQIETVKKVSPAFAYVESGDGFYADGGFVQHESLPYIASYGGVLIYDAMKFEILYANTSIITKENELNLLPTLLKNNYLPFLYDSQMLFSTRGRSVSRAATGNTDARKILIAACVIGQNSDDLEFKQKVSSFAKYQINNDQYYDDYYSGLSIFEIQQLEKLMNEDTIIPQDVSRESKYYNSVDMLNYFGDDYMINLRLSSPKMSSTEIGNGENKLGYMQGAGTQYIYNGDQTQYDSDYVATINPFNYPGTTTDYVYNKPESSEDWGVQFNSSEWVGGVTAANSVSATTTQKMDKITGSDLSSKKSWFYLDNQIVSLGSSISSSASKIDTTVANLKINPDNQELYINGDKSNSYTGNLDTAFLENAGDDLGTGYYFFDSPQGNVFTERRDADYSDINSGRSGEVSESFATVLLDNSTVDNYAYVTLVNSSQNELANYANSPDVQILKNSDDAAVIYSASSDTLMANVYTKYMGKNIKVNKPASIIIEDATSDTPSIYVSDPTEKKDTITIEIDNKYSNVTSNDNVYLKGNKLYFDVSNNNGETIGATIS